MEYPKMLTDEEWNLLQDLTSYNGMDCWFHLIHLDYWNISEKLDYVYDLEKKTSVNLHDALGQVADGLVNDDLDRFKDGRKIWNGMMVRFGLEQFRV